MGARYWTELQKKCVTQLAMLWVVRITQMHLDLNSCSLKLCTLKKMKAIKNIITFYVIMSINVSQVQLRALLKLQLKKIATIYNNIIF